MHVYITSSEITSGSINCSTVPPMFDKLTKTHTSQRLVEHYVGPYQLFSTLLKRKAHWWAQEHQKGWKTTGTSCGGGVSQTTVKRIDIGGLHNVKRKGKLDLQLGCNFYS